MSDNAFWIYDLDISRSMSVFNKTILYGPYWPSKATTKAILLHGWSCMQLCHIINLFGIVLMDLCYRRWHEGWTNHPAMLFLAEIDDVMLHHGHAHCRRKCVHCLTCWFLLSCIRLRFLWFFLLFCSTFFFRWHLVYARNISITPFLTLPAACAI